MAFSKAPEQDTYSSSRISCAYNMDLRPNADIMNSNVNVNEILQDAGTTNLLPYKKDEKTTIVETRPAMKVMRVNTHASDGLLRGIYVWEVNASTVWYVCVQGTKVLITNDYVSNGYGGGWGTAATLLTSATTPVRFTEFIDGTNVKKLVLVDGVEGYVINTSGVATKITDADFPTPHIPWPVFIDGYLFLAKANTGDIYNSDLNTPETWTAGSFISSELYPDDVRAIVKVNNYLLAIGTHGCEYFYDAANATASPLARYEGGSLPFGTLLPSTIATNKNTVIFIANNNEGQSTFKIIEDFKHKDMDSSFIVPLLNKALATTANVNDGSIRAYMFREKGKLFYGINFKGDVTTSASENYPTFVYCPELDWWTQFTLYTGDVSYKNLPVHFTAPSISGKVNTFIAGNWEGYGTFGVFMQGTPNSYATNTATDQLSTTSAATTTNSIRTTIRTPNLDFGTMNMKTMSRWGIVLNADNSAYSTGFDNLSVSYTDDDYETFSTARVPATDEGSYFRLTQLGKFRQRAFKIDYYGDRFIRYMFMEMDINKGQQ